MNFTRIGFSAASFILICVAFMVGEEARLELAALAFIALLFIGLWLAGKRTLYPTRGAVTVTYQFPVQGIVAPVASPALANGWNTVRGNVIATANGDVAAVITHNFGLSPGALANGQPEVLLVPLAAAFYTSLWFAVYTDGNNVTLTKSGAAGGAAGVQCGFVVRRPASLAI
jgi:hypothetical protein